MTAGRPPAQTEGIADAEGPTGWSGHAPAGVCADRLAQNIWQQGQAAASRHGSTGGIMSEGKIDYGKLANKLAGDAGKVTRKLIDFGVSVVKPENIAKVGGVVRGLADAAADGWRAAGEEDKAAASTADTAPTADCGTRPEHYSTRAEAEAAYADHVAEADGKEREQAPVEDEAEHDASANEAADAEDK